MFRNLLKILQLQTYRKWSYKKQERDSDIQKKTQRKYVRVKVGYKTDREEDRKRISKDRTKGMNEGDERDELHYEG